MTDRPKRRRYPSPSPYGDPSFLPSTASESRRSDPHGAREFSSCSSYARLCCLSVAATLGLLLLVMVPYHALVSHITSWSSARRFKRGLDLMTLAPPASVSPTIAMDRARPPTLIATTADDFASLTAMRCRRQRWGPSSVPRYERYSVYAAQEEAQDRSGGDLSSSLSSSSASSAASSRLRSRSGNSSKSRSGSARTRRRLRASGVSRISSSSSGHTRSRTSTGGREANSGTMSRNSRRLLASAQGHVSLRHRDPSEPPPPARSSSHHRSSTNRTEDAGRQRRLDGSGDRAREVEQGFLRCLPNVLFIGASKCGTSSMRSHLVAHPGVRFIKRARGDFAEGAEVHRFDRPDYDWSWRPVELALEWGHSPAVPDALTPVIHYTPHYLYAPTVPFDVAGFYPHSLHLRFLVMLREPVSRAVSSYWFKQPGQKGGSGAEFHQDVLREIQRRRRYEACRNLTNHSYGSDGLRMDLTMRPPNGPGRLPTAEDKRRVLRCFGDTNPESLIIHHVNKGVYVDQLERWFTVFPQNNFLVVSLEEFHTDSEALYRTICGFLGVNAVGPRAFATQNALKTQLARRYNEGKNPNASPIMAHTRQLLENFYAPYNEALFRLLGKTFDW